MMDIGPYLHLRVTITSMEIPISGVRHELHRADALTWMYAQSPGSYQAIVTDPPFGAQEYTADQVEKLRGGRGGVWRIPPAIGGSKRRPLPRFTVLTDEDRRKLQRFFEIFARAAMRILVPGAHVFLASNPLLSHLAFGPMIESGFEKRGEVVRLVRTLRGGDRPKNAEEEFAGVTVMPRSCWEPWGVFRKPFTGRVQDCLREHGTGALRRISDEQPFADVIESAPARGVEREVSDHPSLKPQAFMRQIVRASLPLGRGTVLDPFMGSGSTVAAAAALGIRAVGVELDEEFFTGACSAVPRLAAVAV